MFFICAIEVRNPWVQPLKNELYHVSGLAEVMSASQETSIDRSPDLSMGIYKDFFGVRIYYWMTA
jgi:hypothetical protein